MQFVCSNSIQKILVHDIVLCLKSINLLTTTIIAPPSNASKWQMGFNSAFKGLKYINPLNTQLNSICHLLSLLVGHHILHVSRIRVNIMKLNVYCV